MSDKDTCYYDADIAGNVVGTGAGVATFSALAPESLGIATVPIAYQSYEVGQGVNHAVDHLGQHLCDQIYDGTTLAAVDFDSHSNVVTYSFEHEGSSHITFESYDMTCAPHDDGMCIPAQETGHSDAVDHASTGVDSTD